MTREPETENNMTDLTEYLDRWADAIVLPGETKSHFLAILESFRETFQPASELERAILLEMATAYWQRSRMFTLELGLFRWQMEDERRIRPDESPAVHAWYAAKSLASDPACLDLLGRLQRRHHRTLQDDIKILLDLRQLRNGKGTNL